MSRILIAVPTFETITPDTFKAIWDLDKGDHEVLFDFIRGYDCATARNKIAMRAQELGADYVLMVDNDVTPPRDALLNLMEHGKQVVSGFYAHRNAHDNLYTGRTCACRLYDADGRPYFNYPLESEYTAAEMREMRENGEHLVEIHGGGMGCILIETRVFDMVPYPWYDWVNYQGENRGMLSEDLFFCERCHNEGITVYVDTRVACGHLLRHIQQVWE